MKLNISMNKINLNKMKTVADPATRQEIEKVEQTYINLESKLDVLRNAVCILKASGLSQEGNIKDIIDGVASIEDKLNTLRELVEKFDDTPIPTD